MNKPLFEFLFQPGEAIEVRVVAPWCGSGFFNNAADLADALGDLDGLKPEAVYCSLNPVTTEAFERCPNQFQRAQRGVKLACNGADISRRAWILIDFDPVRRDPALGTKVSSTDAEKSLALSKMRLVRDYLLSEGAPPMVEADSGNGVHLLLPCDLSADKDSSRLVHGCLEFLSAKFSDAQVKVDTVNWKCGQDHESIRHDGAQRARHAGATAPQEWDHLAAAVDIAGIARVAGEDATEATAEGFRGGRGDRWMDRDGREVDRQADGVE